MANGIDMPEVLAFEKKLVPSDGRMYGTSWNSDEICVPLKLEEKSVRGTISNRLKAALKKDPGKLDAEVEKANLQTVDHCALSMEHDTLKVMFTLKVLSGVEQPSACNKEEFRKSYEGVVKNYIEKEGFKELGRRYAYNLANARFLWRNRFGAEKVKVVITSGSKKDDNLIDYGTFDSLAISTKNFDDANEQVEKLGCAIAEALCCEDKIKLFTVEAFAKIGNGQDVYPSEELVLDKGKGNKSKILYSVDDIAGMHSQKIGNALRTIDTWYPEYEESFKGPIAVEPYGAVTNMGKAFRTPKSKSDFYTLFDKYAIGESLESIEEEHFVMANLVRGGVFGKSSKE